jgi:hypothetical protein
VELPPDLFVEPFLLDLIERPVPGEDSNPTRKDLATFATWEADVCKVGRSGSPHWTHFELLRLGWPSNRTRRESNCFSERFERTAYSRPRGHSVWTGLELGERAPDNFRYNPCYDQSR